MSSEIAENPLFKVLDKHENLDLFADANADRRVREVKYEKVSPMGRAEVYKFVLNNFYTQDQLEKISQQYQQKQSVHKVETTMVDGATGMTDDNGNSIVRVHVSAR